MSLKFELKRPSSKLAIFVLICITIFFVFYYIFLKLGNNKISQSERIDDILEKYLNYEADVVINISSNKTENTYKMKQVVTKEYSKIVLEEPKNISGMIIENTKDSIKIINSVLNVEKCYEKQEEFLNNFLFLNIFVNEFKENESNVEENEDEIKVKIRTENNNTYVKNKELIIDKKTYKPKELIIRDNTNQERIRIIYNDVRI